MFTWNFANVLSFDRKVSDTYYIETVAFAHSASRTAGELSRSDGNFDILIKATKPIYRTVRHNSTNIALNIVILPFSSVDGLLVVVSDG